MIAWNSLALAIISKVEWMHCVVIGSTVIHIKEGQCYAHPKYLRAGHNLQRSGQAPPIYHVASAHASKSMLAPVVLIHCIVDITRVVR